VTKRLFDFVVSILALVLLALPLLLVTFAVRLLMGSPVLFRQQRPGLGGRPFTMLKFRTMRDTISPDGRLLEDAERLTQFGRLLRATSIDELPELLNVLKGDMSLVGPRPLLMEYLPRYNERQARRHEVKPGISGWAQINGRNAISWEQKFELDVWYVEHWSFWLDLRILCRTLVKVVSREGISQGGEATTREFLGNGKPMPCSDEEKPPCPV
jgi:lipopolysaccharide/colanic/teichoic acid biosynthesis glycosyltransferase